MDRKMLFTKRIIMKKKLRKTFIWVISLILCVTSLLWTESVWAESGDYEIVTITCGKESLQVAKLGKRYYAYNPEMNFYAFHKKTKDEKKIYPYVKADGAVLDWDVVYSSTSSDWSKGKDKTVFQAMATFYKVAVWYRDVVGYNGIDGKGGCAIIVPGLKETAMGNLGTDGYITFMSPLMDENTEILAHEYGHALLKHTSYTHDRNEGEAMHEGVGDVFAALYDADQDWVIGPKKNCRDITQGTIIDGNKTAYGVLSMDDYIYDKASEAHHEAVGEKNWFRALFAPLVGDYTLQTSEKHKYGNSFILSHTMYLIWDKIFEKDSQTLARTFYRTLGYLNPEDRFSSFRDAFLIVLENEGYSSEKLLQCEKIFDKAAIKSAGVGFRNNLQKRLEAEQSEKEAASDLTIPSKASEWEEFLGKSGRFSQYTGAPMDGKSLEDIHITFAELTGAAPEEMVVVRPNPQIEGKWVLEVYGEYSFVITSLCYYDINLEFFDRQIDLITEADGVSYILKEADLYGRTGYQGANYDHISLLGGATELSDGVNDISKRSDSTLLVYVENGGALSFGSIMHTIPEYFPDLY